MVLLSVSVTKIDLRIFVVVVVIVQGLINDSNYRLKSTTTM